MNCAEANIKECLTSISYRYLGFCHFNWYCSLIKDHPEGAIKSFAISSTSYSPLYGGNISYWFLEAIKEVKPEYKDMVEKILLLI